MRRTRTNCGPRSVIDDTQPRGLPDTPEQLVKTASIFPSAKHTAGRNVSAPASVTCWCIPVARDLKAVMTETGTPAPVLVMQEPGIPTGTRWHYAVVVGYDLDKRENDRA